MNGTITIAPIIRAMPRLGCKGKLEVKFDNNDRLPLVQKGQKGAPGYDSVSGLVFCPDYMRHVCPPPVDG